MDQLLKILELFDCSDFILIQTTAFVSILEMRTVATTLTALALLYVDYANAFWRMNCGIIQKGRIEPLVTPGGIAAHVHTIVGGSSE